MALLFFDGFEGYQNYVDMGAVSSDIISGINTNGTPSLSNSYGRRGSRGIRNGVYDNSFTYLFADNYATMIFGIAVRSEVNSPFSYDSGTPLFRIMDGGSTQLRFHAQPGGELSARRGDGTLLGTTSGANITYNIWRYIEVKVTIDNSAGVVEIRSDGNTVLNLTSQDTQNTANAYLNRVRFRVFYYGSFNGKLIADDLYFLDTTGSKNNDFLGDVRVDVIRPDGAGTYTTFTPSAGSNYENVDEVSGPDDNTTYNDGDTLGNKDSYALSSLSATGGTIHGVKSQATVRKTDAGVRSAKILTRAGTTDDLGSDISLSDSFQTKCVVNEDNPDDAAAWEEADVNAMEVGVEITN